VLNLCFVCVFVVPQSLHDTALCFASQEGHLDVVEALLAAGAVVNPLDVSGLRFRFVVQAHMKRVDRVPHLLLSFPVGPLPLSRLCVVPARLRPYTCACVQHSAPSPLLLACESGHLPSVKTLLSHGATVDLAAGEVRAVCATVPGVASWARVWLCARAFARFRFLVVLWCHAGFDFVRVCSCAPCLVGGMRGQLGGATPLTMASKYGHTGIVAALIEGGADVGLAMVSDPSLS
jgi:hypothetical protein